MKSKPVLTAADVQIVIDASAAHATAQGWGVTIAVADDGGHLLNLRRLDGAAPYRPTSPRLRRSPPSWAARSRVPSRK